MQFAPTFNVHLADPYGFDESPFIVTTAYTNQGGYPIGEWFLVVPDNGGTLFGRRARLNHTAFPDGPVQFNEAFLLEEMLSQAQLRLRAYILKTKGADALTILGKRLDPLASDPNLFVHYWLRGAHAAALSDIRTGTQLRASP